MCAAPPGGSGAAASLPHHARSLSSSKGQAAREVTWDEMGQLGLHTALHEYYKARTLSGCLPTLRCSKAC